MRPFTPEDLRDLRLPSSLHVGHGRVAWVEGFVEGVKNRGEVVVREGDETWRVPREACSDASPRCGPGGVAFVRTPDLDGHPKVQQLCVATREGVRVVTERAGAFSGVAWLGAGGYVVVYADHDPVEEDGKRVAIRVTRPIYKLDGVGYLPTGRTHLYAVDLQGAWTQLTDGDQDDTEPAVSADGTRVAFLSYRRGHRLDAQDAWVLDLRDRSLRRVTHEAGPTFSLAWAPDGTWLAAVRSPGPPGSGGHQLRAELFRLEADGSGERILDPGNARCHLGLTIDDLHGLAPWNLAPAFAGGRVWAPVSVSGQTWLMGLGDDGPVVRQDDVVMDVAADGERVYAIVTSETSPGRVLAVDPETLEAELVAWPTRPWLEDRQIARPAEWHLACPEGHEVQGWCFVPEGEGPFPVLVNIHGGPIVQYGRALMHEVQWWVGRGYAVVQCNPRGSRGYGDAFAQAIHRDWGRPAADDVMAFLDAMLERDGRLDPHRVGVMGGSYGGYLTGWIIGHHHRFKAACVQRTVSDMAAMLACDFGFDWGHVLGAQPWEDRKLYDELSPITRAADIETPLLILHGLGDLRTPAHHGELLFHTLKLHGKDVEMVLFPGASHGLSRSGDVRQRIARLEALAEWFDRKLRGVSETGADR